MKNRHRRNSPRCRADLRGSIGERVKNDHFSLGVNLDFFEPGLLPSMRRRGTTVRMTDRMRAEKQYARRDARTLCLFLYEGVSDESAG
jgi:hypothetical protein